VDTQVQEAAVREDAFEIFYRRWFTSVARSMALIVQDVESGKEIAQDGFRKTWERWSRLSSPDHARNFVFEVSLNEARSILRQRRRERFLLRDRGETEADVAGATTDRIAVFSALAALTLRERECVVLIDYLGYDSGAAARVLRTRPSTVRVHLARARSKLRRLLGDSHD
jgi:RNA polymerase sigma factor (sigma-70 family)